MPSFKVKYAFEHTDESAASENEKEGWGILDMEIDKTPETLEEKREVAKYVYNRAKEAGRVYQKLSILKVTEVDDEGKPVDGSDDDVIEGVIVD